MSHLSRLLDSISNSRASVDENGPSTPGQQVTLDGENSGTFRRTGFPKFSKLPAELRIMIWKYFYLDPGLPPRVVTIKLRSIDGNLVRIPRAMTPYQDVVRFYSPSPVPNLALINRESRGEFDKLGIKLYEKRFAPAIFGSQASTDLPGDIEFDYAKDIALLSDIHTRNSWNTLPHFVLANFLGIEDIRRIQKVAISGWDQSDPSHTFSRFVEALPRFVSLKEIYLAPKEAEGFYDLDASDVISSPNAKRLFDRRFTGNIFTLPLPGWNHKQIQRDVFHRLKERRQRKRLEEEEEKKRKLAEKRREMVIARRASRKK